MVEIKRNNMIYPPVAFGLGGIIFCIVYGVKILNPFYVDWLLGLGDLSQHYLGWELFRQGEWGFPIGMTNRAAYPLETSVIFTDSIPIFAVLFKLFDRILPQQFQYFGLWGVLCFGLQGYYAAKIFNLFKLRKSCAYVGCSLLILSPLMIYRMYMHTALAAQWLVLLSIYLFLKHDTDYKKCWKVTLEWMVIGTLVAGIHLYFLPMCFFFVLGYIILSIYKERKFSVKYILPLVTYILAVFFNTWLLGGFSSRASSGATGLGECNVNLNAFINPRGYSTFLSDLGGTPGQHEGFAYFGLGLLIIIGISLVLELYSFIKEKKILKINSQAVVLIIIAIASTIFAIATEYMWGDIKLLSIPIPEKIAEIWAIFRATGRYIWILWYLIAIYSIKAVSKLCVYWREKLHCIGTFVLILCTGIQLLDMSEVLANKNENYSTKVEYEYIEAEFWNKMIGFREFEHICIAYQIHEIPDYMEWGAIATKYDLSVSQFYFARKIENMLDSISEVQWKEPLANTIYVFMPEQKKLLEDMQHTLRFYNIGKYIVGVTWLDDQGKVNDFSY